jgi:hypothetical protein
MACNAAPRSKGNTVSFRQKPYGLRGTALADAGTDAKIGRDYLRARGWKSPGIRDFNFRWLDRQEVLGMWNYAEDKSQGKGQPRIKRAYRVIGAVLLPFPNDPLYGVARMFYSKADDEAPKFRTPSKRPAIPYIPDGISTKASTPLVLVESPFKAALATWKGLPGIGINGCTGCHVKGEKVFRPSLLKYLPEGREVSFATDADCESNPMVGRAQLDFLTAASTLGCKPVFRPLPAGGIDDYLVDHTVEDFHELKTFKPTGKRVAMLREFVRTAGDHAPPAADDSQSYGLGDNPESLNYLLTSKTEPIAYLFEGLIARSACSILAGPPKGFKSTFALWLSMVATGAVKSRWRKFGAVKKSGKVRVGYIDIEQSKALFVATLNRFRPDPDARGSFQRFPMEKFKLDARGLEELENLIKRERLELLVIDSVIRIRPTASKGSVTQQDAELLDPVTKMAHRTMCHIMLLAHTGKRKDFDNPLDMIGSTSQLAAAVDDVFIIYKPKNESNKYLRHLFVTGRHIPDFGTYVIESQTDGFAFYGEETDVVEGGSQKEVIAVLRDQFAGSGTPAQLAKALAKSPNAIVKLLIKLKDRGLVTANQGTYKLMPKAIKEALDVSP